MNKEIMNANFKKILIQIMNSWIWSRLDNIDNIESHTREKEQKQQNKEIDIWLITKNKKKISVSEKVHICNIEDNLYSFAFNLYSIDKNKKIKQGWFLDNSLNANMYMLIYPYLKTTNLDKLTYQDFAKLECILISKKEILLELTKYGLTVEYFNNEIKKLENSIEIGKHFLNGLDWCYLNISKCENNNKTYIELIIQKEKLIELANQTFIATQNKTILGKGLEKGTLIESNLFGKFVRKCNI